MVACCGSAGRISARAFFVVVPFAVGTELVAVVLIAETINGRYL